MEVSINHNTNKIGSRLICTLFAFIYTSLLYGQIAMEDVTSLSGIDHSHISPIYMGGGVALFDFNNDGFDDIYLTGGVVDDKLYQNNGNLQFTDVTSATGLKRIHDGHSMSVTTGDIDNDGYQDVFVTYGEKEVSRLYRNIEGKKFVDITAQSGVDTDSWSMGASLVDVNMDGYLDIYIINWVSEFDAILDDDGAAVGFNHTCYENNLYINNGDMTFTDLSLTYGVNNMGCGLAVLATDFNNDTYPDLYMANDFGEWVTENTIYQNNYPELEFDNRSAESGLNAMVYGMGIAHGDYDRDGFVDYYITNIGSNVLLLNDGSNNFSDAAEAAGVLNDKYNELNTTGWGAAFADLDNDGYEELVVANGYVPSAEFIKTSEEDPNKIYQNNQDGTFSDISESIGVNTLDISRGVAYSDLDNDGDLDILFTQLSTDLSGKSVQDNVHLYENKSTANNSWLGIRLIGNECGLDGYNAKVFLYSGGDSNYQFRELSSSSSHASQNTSALHFGLSDLREIDSLVVQWPAGEELTVYRDEISVNQMYIIEQGSGQVSKLGCTDSEALNFDPVASYNSGCLYSTVTSAEKKIQKQGFGFSLNPDEQEMLIFFDQSITSDKRVSIIDLSGKSVLESILTKGKSEFSLKTESLHPGIYVMKLNNPGIRVKFFKHDR